MKLLLTLSLFLFATELWAYPELMRYQYNNCTACHLAPSGGGLLTSYGRNLSSEILSTWGSEKEAGILNGMIDQEKLDQYLLLGGDLRAVQVHREDEQSKVGKFIRMQADIAMAISKETWAIATRVGAYLSENVWAANGTSYYAMWKPKEDLSLRAGRFIPQYGLHLMDHIAYIRSFLGFGLNAEKDSLEIQWSSPEWEVSLTRASQFSITEPESATTLLIQRAFADRYKVAVNYWQGQSTTMQRDLYGLWSVLGFTQKLFLTNEIDWQTKTQNSINTKSFIAYNKLGYTLLKGFDLIALYESQQSDMNDSKTLTTRIGPGFQFYPRPHLELTGTWTKTKTNSNPTKESDYAWLLLHYYL